MLSNTLRCAEEKFENSFFVRHALFMSKIKTLASAAIIALTGPATATANTELISTFAGCTGRLSAQLEYEWLMLDANASNTETKRDGLAQILDLLMHTGQSGDAEILSLRINAKYAQAQLLQRATFNADPDDARRARRAAVENVADCAALLLS